VTGDQANVIAFRLVAWVGGFVVALPLLFILGYYAMIGLAWDYQTPWYGPVRIHRLTGEVQRWDADRATWTYTERQAAREGER
jgi:hypothetical protein